MSHSIVKGEVAPGFEGVRACFQEQFRSGRQIGAGLAVWYRGVPVVDLWGGWADREAQRPWARDTRMVLFSVTKGFVAMAFQLLVDRGLLHFDDKVVRYWPEFGAAGKADMTVRTLLNHRGGLARLNTPFLLDDCWDENKAAAIRTALEQQAPAWTPGEAQGYHALTFGLYASELFRRIAHEDVGAFLEREYFLPTGSDVRLGTPVDFDAQVGRLYPPAQLDRVFTLAKENFRHPSGPDARIFRDFFRPGSLCRGALMNPSTPKNDLRAYNSIPARRASLAWASSTGSARGVAKAYLPFAQKGLVDGEPLFSAHLIPELTRRQGWSERDFVLQKPIGWSSGFVKEAPDVFSPNPESFGHPGMGGALGWVDPSVELAIGYVPNRMSWRVRSRRALELTRAIYDALPHVDAKA